ncbi:MAG: hypothetical protein ACE5HO_19875 [bacterium]
MRQWAKEIGIHNVLGATVASVVALPSKDFLKSWCCWGASSLEKRTGADDCLADGEHAGGSDGANESGRRVAV